MNSRTTPYVHAQFSWNYRAYPFLQEVLQLMREGNFLKTCYDETAVNVLLWKAKANYTLCTIDPYVSFLRKYKAQERSCQGNCHHVFMIIHGAKHAGDINNAYQRLKNLTRLPFLQTINNGFHYLNQTQYTCWRPDSQPSPIYPLICQYPKWKPH